MVKHSVILRGLNVSRTNTGPTILKRTDSDFITAMLAELGQPEGVKAVLESEAQDREAGVLKLFQPVHRTFHLTLVELVCDPFGSSNAVAEAVVNNYSLLLSRESSITPKQNSIIAENKSLSQTTPRYLAEQLAALQPRLDPQRLDSAGLVIRRLRIAEDNNQFSEGWRKDEEEGIVGWIPFGSDLEENLDPDSQYRRGCFSGYPAEIAQRLRKSLKVSSSYNETVSPLFVAPPEVCQAVGRTILYGLIPVTSAEVVEDSSTAGQAIIYDADFVRQNHLPYFLRQSNVKQKFNLASRQLTYRDAIAPKTEDLEEITNFIIALRQLTYEFGAFGDSAEGVALFKALNQIDLEPTLLMPKQVGSKQTGLSQKNLFNKIGTQKLTPQLIINRPLGTFLKQAAQVLVELEGRDEDSPPSIQMPAAWPTISPAQETEIIRLILNILNKRKQNLMGGEGRFEDPEQKYHIRAFVRLKSANGCPPKIVWSSYSSPFKIAPWYDSSSGVAPVRVPLPDLVPRRQKGKRPFAMNPEELKKLQPNVAFIVPSGLFNFLQDANLDDLMEGKTPTGGGPVLDWICGFNIPIITLCAFIVLNIFLQLLNFVFWWLAFIKICIPIPFSKKQ